MGLGDSGGHIRLPQDGPDYLVPGDAVGEDKNQPVQAQVAQTPSMDSSKRVAAKKTRANKYTMPGKENFSYKTPIMACTGNGCCSCACFFPFLFLFDCNCRKHKHDEDDDPEGPEVEMA